MKIENLRLENHQNVSRAVATVIWEDRDRPDQDIYFEIPKEQEDHLACNPHAFLTACIIPAMRYGERRVAIDAEICPRLRDGLTTNMHWFRYWYGDDRQIVPIEAKVQSQPLKQGQKRRTASFFSGGVDALATLRANRLNFPLEHPLSIKEAILVHGLLGHEQDEPDPSFQHLTSSLTETVQDAQVNLIPVYTNIYSHLKDLDPDYSFWIDEFQGAALSAIAHALSVHITDVYIASTYNIPEIHPHASLPFIDINYSSCDLQVHHDGITLSRLNKVRLISDWDIALKNLRVCNRTQRYEAEVFNCGTCEKCIRTKLILTALGAQDKCLAFAQPEVSEQQILKIRLNPTSAPFYEELLPLLIKQNRSDLIKAIQRILIRYQEKDLQGLIKRLDRVIFKGRIVSLSKTLQSLML